MTWFDALILGIVEGITEFLPISSTGHLILTADLLGLAPTDFLSSFEIAIQTGAMLAVVVLYWRLFYSDFQTMKKVAVAFLPTALIGFLLYSFVKDFLLGNSKVVLWALFIGGVVLIVFEIILKDAGPKTKEIKDITYRQSFIIGIVQALAVIPGVSRSGATVVGGLLQGIGRKAIVEFSFLLAVPTIVSATAFDLFKSYEGFTLDEWQLLCIGFFVACITAYGAMKWLLSFVQTHTFIVFGIYRILMAGAIAVIIF